jgi:class 3 adenylate cyclase
VEPLGTVTFLFTDIEGSTGLVRKLRDAYPELLAIHHRLIRDAVRRHGGEEVDNQGDAFFFTFPRAGNAIEAAADAQRFLAAQPWPGDSVVRVRMGIHTGEPGRTATGYHGIGVVRAARISAAGHGGQVLLSAVTHSLVEDDELPGISFRDLGEHRLKDLERAQHLWQLDVAGLPSAFPPPRGIEEQTIKEQFVEPRRHRPRRLPAGAAVLALTIAVVAGYLLTRGGGGVTVVGNSIAAIDPATNRIVSDVRVGQQPGRIAIGYGGVWVLNSGDHTVSHVDPAKNRLAATIPLAATPTDIAVGGGTVWVVAYGGTLAEIDPSADSVRRTFRFGRGQSQGAGAEAAFGYGAVWIASPGFQVIRVDSQSRSHRLVTGSEASAFDQAAVAVGSGKVWASFAENDQVLKVDPTRRRVVDSTRLPRGGTSHELAAGSGHVWATASDPSTLFELSAGDLSLEHVTNVGATPTGVTVGAGSVWVVNQGDGTVSRVAIDSGRVTRTIHIGGAPNSVAVSAGRVWVSVD